MGVWTAIDGGDGIRTARRKGGDQKRKVGDDNTHASEGWGYRKQITSLISCVPTCQPTNPIPSVPPLRLPLPLIAFAILLLLLPSPTLAQNTTSALALDCAPFERLFTQSNMTHPWPKGSCCGSTDAASPSYIINCAGGRVTEVILVGFGLSGTIPDLSAPTELQLLDLSFNNLTGQIPPLTALTKLTTTLTLSRNALSGSIPFLSHLVQLKKLDLSVNNLTGEIPAVSTMTKLVNLFLGRNQLSGPVPTMLALGDLRWVDLSVNNLTGTVDDIFPANLTSCFLTTYGGNRGLYSCKGASHLPPICNSTAFPGETPIVPNTLVCPAGSSSSSDTQTASDAAAATTKSLVAIIGGVVGGLALIVIIALLVMWPRVLGWRNAKEERQREREREEYIFHREQRDVAQAHAWERESYNREVAMSPYPRKY
ncbi:L domain-like protein [Gonapodya prolifera JEL478]|uniref:L domain-like protein n=1 Tax=Gonapodya prolifera (strain JEL478) TaxID=1344416 RepID=A0A139AB98_GONPJ|nr:L domain-like protein [Gonapodya prolifera JEL478]|eukprot:KXS14020.1 L domain-like protein [Gonapodya prolifera JEL478]